MTIDQFMVRSVSDLPFVITEAYNRLIALLTVLCIRLHSGHKAHLQKIFASTRCPHYTRLFCLPFPHNSGEATRSGYCKDMTEIFLRYSDARKAESKSILGIGKKEGNLIFYS